MRMMTWRSLFMSPYKRARHDVRSSEQLAMAKSQQEAAAAKKLRGSAVRPGTYRSPCYWKPFNAEV